MNNYTCFNPTYGEKVSHTEKKLQVRRHCTEKLIVKIGS